MFYNMALPSVQLRLGSEAIRDPSIQRVFVLFDFLPRFVPVTDQRTQSVPKTGALLDIAFSRSENAAPAILLNPFLGNP